MFTSMVQSMRRPLFWMGCVCLLVLVSALAACGGDTGSSSTTSTSNTTSSGSNVNDVSTASSIGTASSASTASSVGTASTSSTASANGTATTNSPMTVVIKESKVAGKDTYVFDPETITVKKGESVTVQNTSDKLQEITMGDAAKAGVETSVAMDKSETMTFNKVGTFTIKSAEGAVITVTVTEQ